MESTCGVEETVEEHEGAFWSNCNKGRGTVKIQRHGAELRAIKEISRDVLPHHQWKGAVVRELGGQLHY